jgi:hypothetical protein
MSEFASIDGLRVHFKLESNSDAPVVFINSLGSDWRIWDDVVSKLKCSSLRYDKRGHGLSDAPTGPYSIQDYANLHEHERGTHGMPLEWLRISQMIGLTSGALEQAVNLSQNMVVNVDRMLENVRASHGLMMTEALSFALAQHMPKSEAKKLSVDLAREAFETKQNLIVLARAKLTVPIDWDSLQETSYLGSNNDMIDRVLEAASVIERERNHRA